MDNLTFTEKLNKQYAYLDQVDFIPYIKKYSNLQTLMDIMEDDFYETELTNNDLLKGWLFNWTNLDELAHYIEKRYGIKYNEVITVEYHRNPLSKEFGEK